MLIRSSFYGNIILLILQLKKFVDNVLLLEGIFSFRYLVCVSFLFVFFQCSFCHFLAEFIVVSTMCNLAFLICDCCVVWWQVNAHVKALRTLCKRQAKDPEEADDLVQNCIRKILSKASQILDKYISEASKANIDSDFHTPLGCARRKGRPLTMSQSLSQAITAVYTVGSLVIVCPSANLDALIRTLHTIITSGSSDTKLNKLQSNTFPFKQTAPSLYIQAWVTMGKICLADGELAKRYIPLFVQVWFLTWCGFYS